MTKKETERDTEVEVEEGRGKQRSDRTMKERR